MMFAAFMKMAIQMAVVYLFGCTGEILIEKGGNLNLGIPGIMCLGALGGAGGVDLYYHLFGLDNAIWIFFMLFVLFFTALFACLGGFIYALFTVTMKANQNVTGLVLTTFGVGVMKFVGSFIKIDVLSKAKYLFRATFIPFEKTGPIGEIFLSGGFLFYLAFILAIVLAIVLSKTRVGLFIRAVGESPATADAQGIPVEKYKYACILIGSLIAGLGGLYYVCDYSGGKTFVDGTIDAYGWLALALVIFSIWRPLFGIAGSIIFGGLTILPNYLNISIVQIKLFGMFPYLFTVLVLIITSIFGKRSVQPPSSLGVNYYREDR